MASTLDAIDPVGVESGERAAAGTSAPRPPVGLSVVAVVIGLVFAAPLAYLVIRNITEQTDLLAELTSEATLSPLGSSLWLAATVSITTSIIGTTLAWLLQRCDLPGRGVLRVLAPLPLVFPSFVGAAALLSTFGPGGMLDDLIGVSWAGRIEGYPAALFALTLFTYPLVYLPVSARLRSLSPSLEESARLLGQRPGEVFRTIVLPQTVPAIRAGALLVFLYTLSDFGVVQQVRYDTLTRVIYETRTFDSSRSFALALVLGVVALAVVVAERAATRRVPAPDPQRVRGATRWSLGGWRWPAAAGVVAFMGAALGGPVASLVWWSWKGTSQAADPWGELTAQLADLQQPTVNTAAVGVLGAAVAVAVVLPVAWLTTRYRGRVGSTSNALIVGGYALPGIAIALALVFWSLGAGGATWLYQSFPVLIAGYVLHFGAQSMRASQVAVAAVPRRVGEAASMLGAHRARRFVTVELRVMLPGLLAGAGLVLLSIMKELPVTLLLHPTGFETLATRIWPAIEGYYLARAGIASLVLVGLSAVLTWLLVLRRSDALR